MASKVQVLAVGITLIFLPTLASPTQWLYTAPRALFGLAGSASASASSPATPASYIADLRKKQEKSELLQNEKDFTEQADLVDGSNDNPEGSGNGDEENEGNNEATPTFLQKKIGKILTKLRLIAQIKNAYHYRPEIHEHETNITFAPEQNQNQTDPNEIQREDIKEDTNQESRIVNIKAQSNNIQSIRPAAAYGTPKEPTSLPKEEVKREPVKIDLNVNEISDKLLDFNHPQNGKLKEHDPSRFGSLGVFFAELVGTIVGLTYGAFAQITSGGQSPVAVSTSEGL